ncbi:sugar phosphate nucleotidyltransferase, partial [Candidatus Aminicenantes bacterium AC-335-K20]|nr:sugar phosphate nucleotidyltransferase [Candidatus Aminicenantes bacterium AC-335-K20]
IVSEKTMLEETIERILPLIPYERIYTVANAEFSNEIYKLVPNLPEKNLIVEPSAKNTAPSLLLATARISSEDSDATIVALPSDHYIRDKNRFNKVLNACLKMAQTGEYIITIGIEPSYPATGYGYIHYSPKQTFEAEGMKFYWVEEFKEKPNLEEAIKYLAEREYFWNSGIFIWNVKSFSEKLKKYTPELHADYIALYEALEKNEKEKAIEIFQKFPSTSIDYALMEKAKGILVIKGDFGWSDVGSWSSLAEILPRDKEGNVIKGDVILMDSKNCIVYNPNIFTSLIGVKDIIVIYANNALLICNKKYDQKIKELVEKLEKENRKEYL